MTDEATYFVIANLRAERDRYLEAAQRCADVCTSLRAERDALAKDAERYHKAMDAYRRTKMEHGLCQPRSRKACSHCAGVEKLDALLAEYKGPRIILAALAGQPKP